MSSILALTSTDSVHGLAILADAAIKGLVILGVAAAVTAVLRRRSAALRHMLWTLALAAMALVPVLSAAMPSLRVPVLPSEYLPRTETAATRPPMYSPGGNYGVDQPQGTGPIESSPLPRVVTVAPPEVAVSSVKIDAPPPAEKIVPPPPAEPMHWSAWVLMAWAAGTVVMVAMLLAGTVAVWRARRQARRVTDERWLRLVADLSDSLGVRRPVTLLESPGSLIPMTCGILHPTILLPAEAHDWADERRSVVLLHELAHIKRADCLTQDAARLVRAIYWFNPLAWLAGRMLRIERERACDDMVLAAGHKASAYASHLLEIVSTLHSVRCPSLAAVAMARRSQFEGRMLAILDPRRNRRRLTVPGLLAAALLIAGIALPLSMLRATAADKAEKTLPAVETVVPIAPEAAIALLKDLSLGEPAGPMAEVALPGGLKAHSVILRTTDWEPKSNRMIQQPGITISAAAAEAFISDEERAKTMNRIDDHVQVWLVPASADAAADLKAALKPTDLPHRQYRELVFMGSGRGYKWYAYAPIYSWVYAQKKLTLDGGDDPVEATFRGLSIEDKGSCTRNTCTNMVGEFGVRSLPYADKALARDPKLSWGICQGFMHTNDPEVAKWLLKQAESTAATVASSARVALVWTPRPEASDAYLKWLEQTQAKGASERNLEAWRLIEACRDVKAAGLEKVLPRVLEAPHQVHDYRLAMLTLREMSGRPSDKPLLDAESEIRQFGNAMGRNFDQAKVDGGKKVLLAGDPAAAAAIAVELALQPDTKSNVAAVRAAGQAVLAGLPGGEGRRVVALLVKTAADEPEYVRKNLGTLLASLGGPPAVVAAKAEDLAWGKAVNGLQAGMDIKGLTDDAKPKVKMVLRIRNAGEKPLKFAYGLSMHMMFSGHPPLTLYEAGEARVYRGPVNTPPPLPPGDISVVLEPGQTDSAEVVADLEFWGVKDLSKTEASFTFSNRAEKFAPGPPYSTVEGLWVGETTSPRVPLVKQTSSTATILREALLAVSSGTAAGAVAVAPAVSVTIEEYTPMVSLSSPNGYLKLTPAGKAELQIRRFVLDEKTGRVTWEGDGSRTPLDKPAILHVQGGHQYELTDAADREKNLAKVYDKFPDIKDGEYAFDMARSLKNLNSEYRVLWTLRYTKDGQPVTTVGYIGRVCERQPAAELPPKAEDKYVQAAMTLFADGTKRIVQNRFEPPGAREDIAAAQKNYLVAIERLLPKGWSAKIDSGTKSGPMIVITRNEPVDTVAFPDLRPPRPKPDNQTTYSISMGFSPGYSEQEEKRLRSEHAGISYQLRLMEDQVRPIWSKPLPQRTEAEKNLADKYEQLKNSLPWIPPYIRPDVCISVGATIEQNRWDTFFSKEVAEECLKVRTSVETMLESMASRKTPAADEEKFRTVYERYKEMILTSAKEANKEELAKKTAAFNERIGGRVRLVQVSRVADGKAVMLLDQAFGPAKSFPKITHELTEKPFVSHMNDADGEYFFIESGGTVTATYGSKYPDDLYIILILESPHGALPGHGLAMKAVTGQPEWARGGAVVVGRAETDAVGVVGAHMDDYHRLVRQKVKVTEVLAGDVAKDSTITVDSVLVNIVDGEERPVAKGESAVWIIAKENWLFRAVKVMADTSENRKAAAAVLKDGGKAAEAAWGEAANGLQAGLDVNGLTNDAKPKVKMVLRVKNAGKNPVKILGLATQAREWGENIPLTVSEAGEAKPYRGPFNDPGPPPPASAYITLAPEQVDSVEVTMDPAWWNVKDLAKAEAGFNFVNLSAKEDHGPGWEKIEGLWVGKAASPRVPLAATAVKATEPAWGEAVMGLQVRLQPDKSQWKDGETPKLSLVAANRGQTSFSYMSIYQNFCQVEVDGRWYGWMTVATAGPVGIIGVGKEIGPMAMPLDADLRLLVGGAELKPDSPKLQLAPGKHTVRVSFTPVSPPRTDKPVPTAISNPVEIEILAADAKAAAGPAGASGVLAPGAPAAGDPVTALLQSLMGDHKPAATSAAVKIGDTAATAVTCQWTNWMLREMPQSGDLTQAMIEEAMKLPEAERAAKLDRQDWYVQFWAVPLAESPTAGGDLVKSIKPNPKCSGHVYYLGRGHGYAWYMQAIFDQWGNIQDKLGLKDGEDFVAMAFAEMQPAGGAEPVDHGYFIGQSGAKAIPHLEKLIAAKSPLRARLVNAMYESNDPAVSRWLVKQAGSEDGEVGAAARQALLLSPRKEAADLYVKWLGTETDSRATGFLAGACYEYHAKVPAETLTKIMAAPPDPGTYRHIFEMSRQAAGKPIPKDVLDAEKDIREQLGNLYNTKFARSPNGGWQQIPAGPVYNAKIAEAAGQALIKSTDPEAAAVVALDLAQNLAGIKADTTVPRALLVPVLKGIPGNWCRTLLGHFNQSMTNPYTRERIPEIAKLCGWTLPAPNR
jgi:beta-lactamase regulating signal transducer with metallopeptidase domain